MKRPRFGPVMQMGFLVDDIEATALEWAEKKGIGPFFIDEHVKYQSFVYRGEDTPVDLTLAFAYCGDIQIELMKQHNYAPAVYSEMRNSYGKNGGLLHMATFTDDIEADVAAMETLGNKVIQRAVDLPGKVESIYMEGVFADKSFHPGSLIEYIQVDDEVKELMKILKDACANWDGKDPIHYMS